MTGSEEAALERRVQQWATTLMRGHKVLPAQLPLTPQHFTQLCSSSSKMQAVLQVAVRQVGTPAHCRHVRLNLHLARLRQSWRGGGGEGCDGGAEVASKQAAAVDAAISVASAAEELARVSAEVTSAQRQMASLRQRQLLLQAVRAQMVADTNICHQHLHHLQHLLLAWEQEGRNKGDEEEEEKNDKRVEWSNEDAAAKEDVAATLERLRNLRLRLLDQNPSGGDWEQQEEEIQKEKVAIWLHLSCRREVNSIKSGYVGVNSLNFINSNNVSHSSSNSTNINSSSVYSMTCNTYTTTSTISSSTYASTTTSSPATSATAAVAALCSLARTQTAQLQRAVDEVDLKADAASLSLRIAGGGSVVDTDSERPGVLQSTEELLCHVYSAHIAAELNSRRLSGAAAAHLNAKKAIASSLLMSVKLMPGSGSPVATAALVEQSIATAGQQALLESLRTAASRLRSSADEAARQVAALRRTANEIASFEAVAMQGVQRLKALAWCVESGADQLHGNCTRARSMVEQGLASLVVPITLVDQVEENLTREFNRISTLPMDCLTAVSVRGRGRVLERELSINNTGNNNNNNNSTAELIKLQQALDKVVGGSSSLRSEESACALVCAARTRVRALAARAQQTARTHAALRSNDSRELATLAIKELCAAVDASDEQLEERMERVLDECDQQLDAALDNTLPRTRDVLEAWWNQPAKNIKITQVN